MFYPIRVSSKFPICGLPLRLDSYNNCQYNCRYCFGDNRRIGLRDEDSSPNIQWLKNKFHKVYDEKDIDKTNFLEVLLKNHITLHGGSQSDCFQPQESELHYTQAVVELCNEYEQKILFSTKSDNLFGVDVNPELHSFQLSVSNTNDDNFLEPNVPEFQDRVRFFRELLDSGFKVGIRIQPYINGVTDVEKIVDVFDGAVHFTLESIKLVPGNPDNPELMKYVKYRKRDFTNLGLLNVKPEIRLMYYDGLVKLFEDRSLSYSIADNDLHHMGNNYCCCGDALIMQDTLFHNTRLLQKSKNYSMEVVFNEGSDYLDCNCSSLYVSDKRNGCRTVKEFYEDRFDRKTSTFSPKFQYYSNQVRLI